MHLSRDQATPRLQRYWASLRRVQLVPAALPMAYCEVVARGNTQEGAAAMLVREAGKEGNEVSVAGLYHVGVKEAVSKVPLQES